MKIATFNINSIRAHAQNFLDFLAAAKPDVVLLQETKATDEQFPHILFDHLGYNVKTFGQKSWNGVAVLAKPSIEDFSRGLPTLPHAADARMAECVVDGRVRVVNAYMPNGEAEDSPKFPYKIEWMKKFTEHIAPLLDDELPTILAGDFNVAIQDIDVWNPKAYEGSSISAPAARRIMQEWLDSGWTDAWREIHGKDKVGYTWIGYRGGSLEKGHGLRLDYFLLNKAARHMAKNIEIDLAPRRAAGASDHAPLVLDIK
ncbi:MAG: exodeoxyribonuclease III [Rickettsiales bacterium]|jgi:exodeoxyribonuclease-3|nr:exodeoxyribonuclease III [Rickettsiales bacterium]